MCGRPVRGLPASRWLRPSSSSICAASICRGAAAALRCQREACAAAESLSTQGGKHLQLLVCRGCTAVMHSGAGCELEAADSVTVLLLRAAHLQSCLHALVEEAGSCLLRIRLAASSQEGAH